MLTDRHGDLVTVILFCMLAFVFYVVLTDTDTDTPHGVTAATTTEEEHRCATPIMEAINRGVEEHHQHTDDQGRVLVMVGSASGKYYETWRLPEERERGMTRAEEAERIESDRQAAEASKKYRQSQEFLDAGGVKGMEVSKERLVVGSKVYLIDFDVRYSGGNKKYPTDTWYQVLVFHNSETGAFIHHDTYSLDRIQELRNRQTEPGSVTFKDKYGVMTTIKDPVSDNNNKHLAVVVVDVDTMEKYIVDTDQTSGYTEIVVKHLETGVILDESDMTLAFYERVQAAKAKLRQYTPVVGEIKEAEKTTKK